MKQTPTCRHLLFIAFCFAAQVVAQTARADAPAKGVGISLESDGFAIASPDGGRLVLGYPLLLDDAQNAIKPSSATAKGNAASIEYPQGVKLYLLRSVSKL